MYGKMIKTEVPGQDQWEMYWKGNRTTTNKTDLKEYILLEGKRIISVTVCANLVMSEFWKLENEAKNITAVTWNINIYAIYAYISQKSFNDANFAYE